MNNQTIDAMSLGVSDVWKRRFELFDTLGAQERGRSDVFKSSAYKNLSWKDRLLLSFNPLAFVGGFVYYLYKGMVGKAGLIFSVTMLWSALLLAVEYLLGVRFPHMCYWLPPSAMSAQLANFDYYRKLTQGESLWKGWHPSFYRRYGVTQMVLGSVGVFAAVLLFVSHFQYSTADARNSDQAIRIDCGLEKVYVMPNELDLFGKEALCRHF